MGRRYKLSGPPLAGLLLLVALVGCASNDARVQVGPDGIVRNEAWRSGSASDDAKQHTVSVEKLEHEIATATDALKSAQDKLDRLVQLRDSHVGRRRSPTGATTLLARSGSTFRLRTAFEQYFQQRVRAADSACGKLSQQIGLHWFPLQRGTNWPKPATSGDTSVNHYQQPEALLVRVFDDGCLQVSSGTRHTHVHLFQDASTGAATDTPARVVLSAAAMADTPVLALATANGEVHTWNLTAAVLGERIIGLKANVPKTAPTYAFVDEHNATAAVSVILAHAGRTSVSDLSRLGHADSNGRISALHVATVSIADSSMVILIGTTSGQVLSLHRDGAFRRLVFDARAPPPSQHKHKQQQGQRDADTGLEPAVCPAGVTAITSMANHPQVAFAVCGVLHVLPVLKPEQGGVSCGNEWPLASDGDNNGWTAVAADPSTGVPYSSNDIISLQYDINSFGVLWATTAAGRAAGHHSSNNGQGDGTVGGDVLVFSPRHQGGSLCKLIARFEGVAHAVAEAASSAPASGQAATGTPAPPEPRDLLMGITVVKGYSIVASPLGLVVFNGTRLPVHSPETVLVETWAKGGHAGATKANEHKGVLSSLFGLLPGTGQEASKNALSVLFRAVVAGVPQEGPGRGASGGGRTLTTQHRVAITIPAHTDGTATQMQTAVSVFDCRLPVRDPLHDLYEGGGAGGVFGWLRGPLFLIAIIIAVMVGRSQASADEDANPGGIAGMASSVFNLLTGTDGAVGRRQLGRRFEGHGTGLGQGYSPEQDEDGTGLTPEEQHYERMVQRLFREGLPEHAALGGTGLDVDGQMDRRTRDRLRAGAGLRNIFGTSAGVDDAAAAAAVRGRTIAEILADGEGGLSFGGPSEFGTSGRGGSRAGPGRGMGQRTDGYGPALGGDDSDDEDEALKAETEKLLRILRGAGQEAGGFGLGRPQARAGPRQPMRAAAGQRSYDDAGSSSGEDGPVSNAAAGAGGRPSGPIGTAYGDARSRFQDAYQSRQLRVAEPDTDSDDDQVVSGRSMARETAAERQDMPYQPDEGSAAVPGASDGEEDYDGL